MTSIVRETAQEAVEIIGASRTDAGAHARYQVAHFDTHWNAPVEKIARILNDRLPNDLAVQKVSVVSPTFHSRFSAVDRFYRYRLRQTPRAPERSRYVYDTWYALDVPAMHEAAQQLVGSHDFFAYSEEVPVGTPSIRELYSLQVRQAGREVWVDIVGNAFMRGMMRRISGALFEVGRGARDPREIGILLDPSRRDELKRPVVLPARGLCLMRIRYGRHPVDFRTRTIQETTSQETGNE